MKCPYKYPLRSRAKIVEYLCGIGGYHSLRNGNFPLAFNVKAWDTDFDWDNVWEKYHEEFLPDEAKTNENVFYAFKMATYLLWARHKDHLWEWGQEDAVHGVTDGDTHRTLWCGKEFDLEWSFAGRSGGYLCPSCWNGYNFRGMSEESFEEELNEMPWIDLYDLYRLAVQWEQDLTPKNASSEVEYQGVHSFFANIVESEWNYMPKDLWDGILSLRTAN